MKNKIILAVCGSIAAIETPKIIRELNRRGVDVVCVMSEAAQKIIHPDVLQWASGNEVITRLTGDIEHVRLAGLKGEAKLLLICPCTSNTISKMAYGIGDNPLTTVAATALGSNTPVVIAPAMHYGMYVNPFVKENIDRLKQRGVHLIEPEISEDKAKLADKQKIVDRIIDFIK